MNTSNDHEVIAITAPFGFSDLVPLQKTHRVVLPEGHVPSALKESNAIPVTITEIPRAARDYPIVFASADEGKSFGVVALLGLNNRENLFVTAEGSWRNDVYMPAYLRRYPFCMATVAQNGQTQDERIVCVERAMLDDQKGLPLEKQDGQKLSWWNERLHLLQEYEADLLRTQQMCDWLNKFSLLKSFGAQAISAKGEVMNLAGMYRVDELRLADLKADELRMLIRKGVMGRIYAHMTSLDNLGRLLDLRTAATD